MGTLLLLLLLLLVAATGNNNAKAPFFSCSFPRTHIIPFLIKTDDDTQTAGGGDLALGVGGWRPGHCEPERRVGRREIQESLIGEA